jgi:hypothetical protein
MTSTNNPASNIDDVVDETVAEALRMADFFRQVHQGQNSEVPQLHTITPEQLKIAQGYLEQPIGIDVFAPSIENKRSK